jgi:hypothetical protein
VDLFIWELIKRSMLRIGGYLNILISIRHIIGLIWADNIFHVTGIGKEMAELT